MPNTIKPKDIALDARPDRLDLRDREYRPNLRSLPQQFPTEKQVKDLLTSYVGSDLILNQGQEGACTGFGLAAVINYLIWREDITVDESGKLHSSSNIKDRCVSERMLYHLARIYDEWDGEDYSGSSCRGAMKGWHRHGVCKKTLWEYDLSGKFIPPKPNWEKDALSNPLGAYYRINKDSVVDMQAAIYEVGAIYCSANVHKGWYLSKVNKLPVIEQSPEVTGGHAFCIVGYNEHGFIVQNSWGAQWGWNGFAVLRYKDWVENGSDAWVSVRGVPIDVSSVPTTYSNSSLQSVSADTTTPAQASIRQALAYDYQHEETKPWSEEKAYQHSLVISNNGRPKLTVVNTSDPEGTVEKICYDNIKSWMSKSDKNKKIAVYVHGGLNAEEDSINRIRVMAPYFLANGIYPLFITWKTGLGETLNNILKDCVAKMADQTEDEPELSEGMIDSIKEKFSHALDTTIETLARAVRAKGIWSEMKENADHACDRAVPGFQQNRGGKSGAMVLMAKSLQKLQKENKHVEIHAVGHSAGSIVLGYWLAELEKRKMSVNTLSLFAPACTTAFANQYYRRAIEKKVLNKKSLFIHNLDDEREKADTVGKIYQKSLLYLVSRALEDLHKMPILGLAASWDKQYYSSSLEKPLFHETQFSEMKKWAEFMKDGNKPKLYGRSNSRVKVNQHDTIALSHGSFDNDIEVLEFTLKKIRAKALICPVENLSGF